MASEYENENHEHHHEYSSTIAVSLTKEKIANIRKKWSKTLIISFWKKHRKFLTIKLPWERLPELTIEYYDPTILTRRLVDFSRLIMPLAWRKEVVLLSYGKMGHRKDSYQKIKLPEATKAQANQGPRQWKMAL
ncbi:hypothetical protein GOBAR_DD17476 [Gossypium barbadense]|nr:hypothetical protein GOBAR_DD17476 [Gossypium barbadense]